MENCHRDPLSHTTVLDHQTQIHPNAPNSNNIRPDDEEEMRSDDIPHTPDDKWVLNNDAYMKREAFTITYTFPKVAEVYSFTERNRAELKRTKKDKEFWTLPDATIDAWMLVTGRKRDVLDIASFVQQNGDIVAEVQQARKAANVLLLTT